MSGPNNRKYSEKRILRKITSDGLVPVEYCFTIDDTVMSWEPNQRGILMHFGEDDGLWLACLDYMRTRTPRNFKSLDELKKWAHDHQWPHLDSFDENILAWRKRLQTEGS